jgi:hypothetical protein
LNLQIEQQTDFSTVVHFLRTSGLSLVFKRAHLQLCGVGYFLGASDAAMVVSFANYHIRPRVRPSFRFVFEDCCGLARLIHPFLGLVSFAIQQELGVSDGDIGNIFTAFSTGLTVGAFFWWVPVAGSKTMLTSYRGLGVDIFGVSRSDSS